jgi:hypothetical protein
MKPIYKYTYRGHKVLVTDRTPSGGYPHYQIRVDGPHKSINQDTHSLDYLKQAIERDIDNQIEKAKVSA